MKSVVGAGAFLLCAVPFLAAPLVAQSLGKDGTREDDAPIIVTGTRDIVVNGHAIRCRRLPADPLTGPVASEAAHISYGFNLQGSGDVWVYAPTLETVADDSPGAGTGDRIVIGRRPR